MDRSLCKPISYVLISERTVRRALGYLSTVMRKTVAMK